MSGQLLNMSEASTGSSSLVEAKKARQHIEQDALLLANRIKLLQSEEAKTKKRIEETKRKTDQMLQAQQRKDNELREKERLKSERQRSNEEARRRFHSLKTQHNAEKLKQRELMWMSKKEAYTEGRSERDRALSAKRQIEQRTERHNQERYRVVKGSLETGNERLSKRKTDITRDSRVQYQQRIAEEERKTQAKEKEVITMEMLEMELINKLKYTQMLEQEAVKNLEKVAKGKANLLT